MIPGIQSNKRRQAPFIDYFNLLLNVICNTLLTVKYCKEAYDRLKKEAGTNGSSVVRKRCRALMAKMSEPGLGSQRIAEAAGCSRNFVCALIHAYNNEGIDAVLRIRPRSGRPGRMDAHLEEIVRKLEDHPVRSRAEAAHIIHCITGFTFGPTWTGVMLKRCGFRFRKPQPVPGKADPLKQNECFLPPYSPNLNIMERLWKYAWKKVLAGRYFETPAKFHEFLRYFFDEDFENHKASLRPLLKLNFQSFENAQILSA